MKIKPAALGESIRVIMTVTGEDARRLREFQEREGLPSPHAAARAMVLVGLEADPPIGLAREERARIAHETRVKLIQGIHKLMSDHVQELQAEIGVVRDVDALKEKAQVTFAREDQE